MVWSHDSTSVRVSAGAGLTYIGVSKVYGEKEQAIWSLGSGKAITRIQTTKRAANLGDGTFMNYAKDSLLKCDFIAIRPLPIWVMVRLCISVGMGMLSCL